MSEQDAAYWKAKFQASDKQVGELQTQIGQLNQKLESEREVHREELKRARRAAIAELKEAAAS